MTVAALLRTLRLEAPCDAKDVQQARRTLSKELHPDLAAGEEAEDRLEQMKRVNAAADELLEVCARFGRIDPARRVPARSRDEQYDFWREQWREDDRVRRARQARARVVQEERKRVESDRLREEFEAYRGRKQAAARRAGDLLMAWEEARARVDTAAAALASDPRSDSSLWRLYGALFAAFPAGAELRAETGDADAAGSRSFTVALGDELAVALGQALRAAGRDMAAKPSRSGRRALGAVLELRRILALDDAADLKLATRWTRRGDAPLHLRMGEVGAAEGRRDFAFITPYGGGEKVFLHASAVPGGALEDGMIVTFRERDAAKGQRAVDVEVVGCGP